MWSNLHFLLSKSPFCWGLSLSTPFIGWYISKCCCGWTTLHVHFLSVHKVTCLDLTRSLLETPRFLSKKTIYKWWIVDVSNTPLWSLRSLHWTPDAIIFGQNGTTVWHTPRVRRFFHHRWVFMVICHGVFHHDLTCELVIFYWQISSRIVYGGSIHSEFV